MNLNLNLISESKLRTQAALLPSGSYPHWKRKFNFPKSVLMPVCATEILKVWAMITSWVNCAHINKPVYYIYFSSFVNLLILKAILYCIQLE